MGHLLHCNRACLGVQLAEAMLTGRGRDGQTSAPGLPTMAAACHQGDQQLASSRQQTVAGQQGGEDHRVCDSDARSRQNRALAAAFPSLHFPGVISQVSPSVPAPQKLFQNSWQA